MSDEQFPICEGCGERHAPSAHTEETKLIFAAIGEIVNGHSYPAVGAALAGVILGYLDQLAPASRYAYTVALTRSMREANEPTNAVNLSAWVPAGGPN